MYCLLLRALCSAAGRRCKAGGLLNSALCATMVLPMAPIPPPKRRKVKVRGPTQTARAPTHCVSSGRRRGPAPMSTTNKVAYASHKTTDVDCLEDAEIDFGHRPPMNGSVTNRVTTVHNVPHDGWRPVTEMKAKYGNHSTGVADFELASRHGVREPGQNDIPPPVAAHGLKPMGLPAVDLVRLTLYDIYGRRGMRALTRTLKDMLGPDGNMKLDKNALVTALQHLGLDPTPQV